MDSLQRADVMEQRIVSKLGIEKAFDEVIRALNTDQKLEVFEFIAESWEIDFSDLAQDRD